MKVIPAILSERVEDCQRMLKEAASFTDYVQVDLMDGVFVPSRSFPGERINELEKSIPFEVHLMVQDPLHLMGAIRHTSLKQAIFHLESRVDPLTFVSAMKERGIGTGLAIRPETSVAEFQAFAPQVDMLLFLTVDPGFYGSPFKTEVLNKIEETRRRFPGKPIAVDGAVSLDNLNLFVELGVDAVCVGSRIFLGGKPEENYRRFSDKAKELEDRVHRE